VLHLSQSWLEDSFQGKAQHDKGEPDQHQETERLQYKVVGPPVETIGEPFYNQLAPGGEDGIVHPQEGQGRLKEYVAGDQND